MQRQKEKDKQWNMKHYTENWRLSNTNKDQGWTQNSSVLDNLKSDTSTSSSYSSVLDYLKSGTSTSSSYSSVLDYLKSGTSTSSSYSSV